jgi:hypothetical protein
MTAKEMFEALGWKLGILKEDDRDDILYYQKNEGSAEYDLDFFFEDKTYCAYGFVKGFGIRYMLNAQEHLAITQQMEELGWLDKPETLDDLFGDVVGDLDKLELVDYGKTYTLEEAKEIVRASKVDTLNKLANAITNSSEEDIDKYWDELFPSKETEE